MADFREFLQEGTFPERKSLIRNFVESINVVGDEATLTYTIPLLPDMLPAATEAVGILPFVNDGPPGEIRAGFSKRQSQRYLRGPTYCSHEPPLPIHLYTPAAPQL